MNLQLLIDNPELAKTVRIETTASDLLLFADTIMSKSWKAATKAAESSKNERYLTQTETCEALQVCSATLWHWKQKKYLVPESRL